MPIYGKESSNDYYVEFSEYETRNQKVIDVAKRGMSHVQLPFFDHEKRFFVRQQLFNNELLLLKDFKSENISIKSLNHQKSIVFHMQGFDHVGYGQQNMSVVYLLLNHGLDMQIMLILMENLKKKKAV